MSFFDISWDNKHNKMESQDEKQGRFPSTLKTFVSMLLQIKGTIRGKDIPISIAPSEHNNYISDEFANELAIPDSNIGERLYFCKKKEYAISDLQWNIWRFYRCLIIYS